MGANLTKTFGRRETIDMAMGMWKSRNTPIGMGFRGSEASKPCLVTLPKSTSCSLSASAGISIQTHAVSLPPGPLSEMTR